MYIKKGDDRVVVILPSLGIVLKFPIIHFLVFLRVLASCFKNRERTLKELKRLSEAPIRYHFGFRGMLFKGLHANWCEFWFYWRTRNVFLQPTYFSLLGLISIQRIGEPCLMKAEDVWCQFCGFGDQIVEDMWKDSHHFTNPKNFCFYQGKVRILDYGSKDSRYVVSRYGAYIVEHFDPTYSWEEVKKSITLPHATP